VSALNQPPFVYGKLPARGDFITRGFERPFLDSWDEWLRQGILASQESLAELWLDVYLTSPVWRFALSGGSCGPDTMLGVLIPSVDKVGRYFPLTLGCALTAGLELTGLVAQASPWYRAIEALALAALEPAFSLDALAQPVALEVEDTVMALPLVEPLTPPGLYVPFGTDAHSAAVRHAHHPLAQGLSLWWTSGSKRVAPCLLICPGMPPASSFAALLNGDWQRRGWTVPAEEQQGDMPAKVEAHEEVAADAREVGSAFEATDDGQAAELTLGVNEIRSTTEPAGVPDDSGAKDSRITGTQPTQSSDDSEQSESTIKLDSPSNSPGTAT
jgi:type VI secretion system protein ImpM